MALKRNLMANYLGQGWTALMGLADYGLTVADLGGATKTPGSRMAVAAKYRHPSTGETWSGRGRPPHWLADEVAKGRKREEFLVG
jgi:DNA-binding protein H-NS